MQISLWGGVIYKYIVVQGGYNSNFMISFFSFAY